MSTARSDAFADIWDKATKRYKELSGKDLQRLDLKSLNNVDDLERMLNAQSHGFSEFRAKRHTLFAAMRVTMLPIQQVGNFASGAASAAFPPSSMIFGAVTFLIGAAKNVSSAYDAIEALMTKLQDFTDRLKVYTREKISPELERKLATILTTLLEVLALTRKSIKEGRTVGFLRNVFLGSDNAASGAMAKLAGLTESEDRLVSAETHSEVSKQSRTLDGVVMTLNSANAEILASRTENREMNEEILRRLQDMDESQDSEETEKTEREKVKTMLCPSVNPQDIYDRINKQRLPGTCDWIQEELTFKAWVDRAAPILWISGIPGAGKSFISSAVINSLQEQYPEGDRDGERVSTGYFFFKDNNPKTRSFHQALRDVAFQISQVDKVYTRYIVTNCQSSSDVETMESAWRVLFRRYFIDDASCSSRAFIVIDGLDEANDSERETFLALLRDLDYSSASRIQIVMAGRPHLSDAICEALERGSIPSIDVTADKNAEDIRNYIQNSIKKSKVLKKSSKDLQDEVVSALLAQANGMFLWVDLMMRELNTKGRPTAIREALQKAPKGLDSMIQHVLENFSASLTDDDAEDLNELLAWTACAQRPLTLGELDSVLKYKSPVGEGVFSLEAKLRRTYASFFLVIRDDGLSTVDLQSIQLDIASDEYRSNNEEEADLEDPEIDFDSNPWTTEITFSHASIGDFFRDKGHSKVASGDGPAIGVDFDAAKTHVLTTLFRIAVNKEFREKIQGEEKIDDLQKYVNFNWLKHLQATDMLKFEKAEKEVLGPMLVQFCRDEDILKMWTAAHSYDIWEGAYVATLRKWFGDAEVIESLSDDGRKWVDATASNPVTTLAEVPRLKAKHWLQDINGSPEQHFWCIYGYLQVLEGKPLRAQSESNVTAEVIEETARWAEFEVNAPWEMRLAYTLRNLGFTDAAEKHFGEAWKLDPTLWGTKSGLAMIFEKRNDLQKALELYQTELKIVLANPGQNPREYHLWLSRVYRYIGNCHMKLNDTEAAYTAHREAWELNPYLFDSLTQCMTILDGQDRLQDELALLKKMIERKIPGADTPYLVRYAIAKDDQNDYFYMTSRRVARELGEFPFLIAAIKDAITESRKMRLASRAVMFELFLSDIYYTDRLDPELAIRTLEKIVAMGSSSKEKTLLSAQQEDAELGLAGYYFERARETRGTPECEQHVRSLEKLCKSKGKNGETIKLAPSSAVLGRWYRINGEPDKAATCFKTQLNRALQILSDDEDPSHLIEAYSTLSSVLLIAGEIERAIGVIRTMISLVWQLTHGGVAFGICQNDGFSEEQEFVKATDEPTNAKPNPGTGDNLEHPATEKDTVQSEPSNDQESDVKGLDVGKGDEGGNGGGDSADANDLNMLRCSGQCSFGRPLQASSYFSLCCYCYDCMFCDNCIEKVKKGTLAINACKSDHEWVRIRMSTLITPIKDGNMFLGSGSEVVTWDEWKAECKKKWGL